MKKAFSKESKHAKGVKKINKTKVVICALIVIVLILGATYLIFKNKNKKSEEPTQTNQENEISENLEDENIASDESEEITMIDDNQINEMANGEAENSAYEDDFPDQIGGYQVIGQVVIDKVGIKRSILNKTTKKSLSLAPTWFDGPSPNKVGNMTITGHNNRTQFRGLYDLNKDDTFYVVDKATGSKVTYKIYDIFTVMPDDTDYVLSQKTNGKREVTLVTCNPGGLTRRIFKAKEV